MFTPIDVNAVLVGFFFDFMSFFPSSFCVCEDANVTHKVSIVKKNKKKHYIVGFVCNIALISVAKPTCHGEQTTQQVGFWSRNRSDVQMEAYSYCG